MEFSLYKNTSLNNVSEDTRNAVLKALKEPLEQHISDTKQSVELINSLLEYISFLEWIFLENWQHFTEEDFKTPWLSSLLITSNRHDEKEKREILEFFKEQYKALYPRIFTGEWFKTIFGFDTPASILIDAREKVKVLHALKLLYSEEKIKKLDIIDEKNINIFDFINIEILKTRLQVFNEICSILNIENTPENAIKYINSKLLSVFTFDQDEVFLLDIIKSGLEGLKKIEWFYFEWIFEVNIFNLARRGSYDFLNLVVDYFQINSAKNLSLPWVEKILDDADTWESGYFNNNKLSIDAYEWWFWRKFTLQEVANGTLKNIKQIYDWVKWYGLNLKMSKIIFDYLNKQKIGIWSLKSKEIDRLIAYIRTITYESIHYEKQEVLKDINGISIDLEWILNEDLFKLLQTITWKTEEESYAGIDITEVLYEPFFQKFPQFVWVNEKWEKYIEKWNKEYLKKENWELHWILRQEVSIDFINLFSDELEDIHDAINNSNFQFFYQNVGSGKKKTIVDFIKFVRKYNLFQINLANIDKDFIIFFNKNFKNEEKISKDINFPQNFFDEPLSLPDFQDPLLKSLILDNSKMFENLQTICRWYNLPITVSSFRKIFSSYMKKYWDIEWFFKFFPVHILTETINFIISKWPKDLTQENLIYILISQYELRLDVWMHHLNFVNEKEQLLQENFWEKACNYFKKDEKGNYIFNREKKTLLKMIFDVGIELVWMKEFLVDFTWLTLWKLVRYYRDSEIWFCAEYENRPVLAFLIQYALDKNDYYYLKHNIDIYSKTWVINFSPSHLTYLLDKTGWFLTATFVKKYILGRCSKEELDTLIQQYNETSIKLLWSDPIEFKEVDDNFSEAVFMAYRPTMFTLDQIKDYLNYKLEDNSGHIKKVKFKREWYEESLHVSEKKLKSDKTINVAWLQKIETEILAARSDTNIFDFWKFDVQKFFTSATNLDELYPLLGQIYCLNIDYRIQNYRQNMWEKFYDYTRLYALSNIFWIITKDSFWDVLISQFSSLSFEELKNIFWKLEKIKDSKFKKIYNENYKQEYLESNNMLFSCFIDIFYTQLKFIASRIKKELDKELAKFWDEKWKWEKIRFSICKNIASFFAMAGSQLCTANDIERHNEERYVPVNIIDDTSKQIIGMLMMYVEAWRDYLIVRWLNFRSEIFQKYDANSLTEAMMTFVQQFALENNYKKVYIPENCSQHLLSNSDVLRKKLQELSAKNDEKVDYEKHEKFYWSRIGNEWGFVANTLYLLLDL